MAVAKWFTAWAEAEDEELSNMKLQKLLYYAQGHHLALHGTPLFREDIQAWSHGPVVPVVCRAFKEFGAAPVELPWTDSFSWNDVDEDTAQFLGKVWNTYGGYAAGRLRNMTHDELPWKKNWHGESERDAVIPTDDLRDYFATVRP
jgi:uncharacterized phage-associated protein